MTDQDIEPIHVISYGGGVQSTRLLFAAARGEIGPMPVAAVWADTGDEPEAVYRHIEWTRSLDLPFPIIVTRRTFTISQAMEVSADAKARGDYVFGQKGSPPLFVREADGSGPGMIPRQCTENWKIGPLEAVSRALAVEKWGETFVRSAARSGTHLVTQWLGISTDEASRMKQARRPWLRNRYPLAMELRESRNDCLQWFDREGLPRPPRSACWHCPYRSAHEWRLLRDEHPEDWAKAVALDHRIRGGLTGTRAREAFLHRDCVPLDEVDLETAEERGQLGLWGEECAGMCGV